MGATFVMSFPGPDWHVAAGANRRSAAAKAAVVPANPRAALKEWIALADAILYAGGRIVVVDPKPGNPGAVYTADWGALVRRADQPLFLLAQNRTAHRAAEVAIATTLFAEAGVTTLAIPSPWGGRGDFFQVAPSRYVFLAGSRTAETAGAEVVKEVGNTVRFIEGKVKAPFEFGDEVLAVVSSKGGLTMILAHQAGIANRTIAELRSTFAPVEVVSVDSFDVEAGACTALSVNGTVIMPEGSSTAVRSVLARNGFQLVEIALPQLLGLGGGGPHALVNELVGFVIGPGAPDYVHARERIVALVETYPETIAPSGGAT